MDDINNQIDELVKEARADVKKAINESGKTQTLWLMTSKDAIGMLGEWSDLTDLIKEEYGIDLPPLIEGVTVNVTEVGK
jgi:hypothetical protein